MIKKKERTTMMMKKDLNLFDMFDMFEDETETEAHESTPEESTTDAGTVIPEQEAENELPWNEEPESQEEDPVESLHPEDDEPEDDEPENEETEGSTEEKSSTQPEEKKGLSKAQIEKLKEDPEALKEAAKTLLRSWLNAKELENFDSCLNDVREAEKPDSAFQIHAKIMREYDQNQVLIAGLLIRMEKNISIAEDVLQDGKSLSGLNSFVQEKARKEAEAKNKNFGGKGAPGMAVIESSLVYEWAEDYAHRDEEEEKKKREKNAPKITSSKKQKSKKDDTMSLFDLI